MYLTLSSLSSPPPPYPFLLIRPPLGQYPPSSSDHHLVSTPVPTLLIRPPLGQYPPSSSHHHWVSTPVPILLIRTPLGQYGDNKQKWVGSVGGRQGWRHNRCPNPARMKRKRGVQYLFFTFTFRENAQLNQRVQEIHTWMMNY